MLFWWHISIKSRRDLDFGIEFVNIFSLGMSLPGRDITVMRGVLRPQSMTDMSVLEQQLQIHTTEIGLPLAPVLLQTTTAEGK